MTDGTLNDKAQQPGQQNHTMPDHPADAPGPDATGGIPKEIREQLIPLTLDESSNGRSFMLHVRRLVENPESPLELGGYVDVVLDEDGDDDPRPMLVLLPIEEDERDMARFPRKVTGSEGKGMYVRIPTRLLEGTEYERGLDIDLPAYTNENQLLFEPLVGGDIVGAAPLAYGDGTEYERAPPDADYDTTQPDGTGRAPGQTQEQASGTAPEPEPTGAGAVPAEAIDEASAMTGVARDALHGALTAVTAALDAGVLHSADVVAEDYESLEHDDAVLYVLDEDAWGVLAPDLPDDVRAAVAQAFVNAAQRVVQDAGAKEFRRFSRDHAAVVLPIGEQAE